MKKIMLIASLAGGLFFVSRASETPNGSKLKAAVTTAGSSSVHRINDVTICRDCGNGNQACGTGANATEARAVLSTAVKAGC